MTAIEVRPLTSLGRLHVALVALGGALLVAQSVLLVVARPPGPGWWVLSALTLLSGSFAVKVPSLPATICISETFVFAIILLFGPAPAVVTVAIDGALISLRLRHHELRRYLFNVGEPAVSFFVAAMAFYAVAGSTPLGLAGPAHPQLKELLLPVAGMAVVYFLLNSWLTAVAVTSETGISAYDVWRQHFLWLGMNTLGGASLGLVLAINVPWLGLESIGQLADAEHLSGVGVIVPLLFISYFTFRTTAARVEDANRHLDEMSRLHFSTVETLATAIDAKDQVTFGHIRRVQHYAVTLARAVGVDDEGDLKAIETAALLHDMGKLAIPEFILNKPGRLTPAEYERIKLHAPVGAEILSQIDFPYPVVPIVRHHHENWDGTGYPDGLAGAQIPLAARIMGVVDCYDALTSDRPYRPALSREDAIAIIRERAGTMYDPDVVRAFIALPEDVMEAGTSDERALGLVRLPWPMPQAQSHAHAPEPGNDAARGMAEQILLLCDLAEGLAGRMTADDVADVMARHLRRLVPATLVVFYMPDEASGSIVARHVSGPGDEVVRGLRIPMGHGLSGWVAVNRGPIVNSNPVLDLGDRLAAIGRPLQSALSTALVTDGDLVGVLALYADGRDAFSPEHARVVELVSRQVSAAITRAARFEEQRRQQLHDDATGLPNGRSFDQLAASCAFGDARLISFGVLCVGVADEGAVPREQLVCRVASAARQVLRSTDLVFRYSDEELVILLPDAEPAVTARIARRLVESVTEGAAGVAHVPLLLGIAFAPQDGGSVEELLKTARGRVSGTLSLEAPLGLQNCNLTVL